MSYANLEIPVNLGNPATSRPGGEYNGAIYLFTTDYWFATEEGDDMRNLRALKSTDNGATFTEMDASNAPVFTVTSDGPAPMYAVAQNGSKFYILQAKTEDNPSTGFAFLGWALVIFDAATDTWGTYNSIDGPTNVDRASAGYLIYLEILVRGTTDMIVLFSSTKQAITGYYNLSYCTFNGSTLGEAVAFSDLGIFPLAAVVDDSKRSTIWYQTMADNKLCAITLSTLNVFGTKIQIGTYGAAGSWGWGDWSRGLSYTRNGVNHVAVAYTNYSSGSLYVYLLDAEAADQPTFVSSQVGQRATDYPESITYNTPRFLSIASNSGIIAVIWANSDKYYELPCNFLYSQSSTTGAFSWAEAAELMVTTQSEDLKYQAAQVYAFPITSGIGVIGVYESAVVVDPLVSDLTQFAVISLTLTVEIGSANLVITPKAPTVFLKTLPIRPFSDAQIEKWARERLRMIDWIVDRWSPTITVGRSEYEVPNYITNIRQVIWKGREVYPKDFGKSTFTKDSVSSVSSIPTEYTFNGKGLRVIKFFGTPNESIACYNTNPDLLWSPVADENGVIIEFYRTPTDVLKFPYWLNRYLLKNYICMKAFSLEGKSQDLRAARYYTNKVSQDSEYMDEIKKNLVMGYVDVLEPNMFNKGKPGRPILPPEFTQ